jgi:hypothetical protein
VSERPYRLVVLAADGAWCSEVVDAMKEALLAQVGREDLVAFEDVLSAPTDPAEAAPQTVVIFLADATSRADQALVAQLDEAHERLVPVLPAVRPGADVAAVLPDVLQPLNAVTWEPGGAAAVRAILRLLGLIERERRLFLSYRRHDTSSLALQLREQLSRRAYDVFLDRFSVPPAADFQRRIDVELSDKAFVLLLESPSAVGSEWVQHEVAYALSHGISLLALSMPDTPKAARFPSVDKAFRLELDTNDLETARDASGSNDMVLTSDALETVLDEIETRYARQLRRRRASLLGSLEEWLQQAGGKPRQLADEWAVAADIPGGEPSVYLITPRAPSPSDLRRLDGLRPQGSAHGGFQATGHLVFAAPAQDEEDKRLIAWIVDQRPLSTHPHVSIPDFLGIR